MLTFILLCLLVGSVVGFLAGLFGIGGGLIIVPTLVYLLPMVGVPEPLLMSTALGTSFATIVITGFSSAQRHHKLWLCHYSRFLACADRQRLRGRHTTQIACMEES